VPGGEDLFLDANAESWRGSESMCNANAPMFFFICIIFFPNEKNATNRLSLPIGIDA